MLYTTALLVITSHDSLRPQQWVLKVIHLFPFYSISLCICLGVLQVAGWSSWKSRVWVMSASESHSGTCEYFRLKEKSPVDMQGAFLRYLKGKTCSMLFLKGQYFEIPKGRLKMKHLKHLSHPTMTLTSWGIIDLPSFMKF